MLRSFDVDHKIIPFINLSKWTRKNKRKKIVLVGGCFDVFHFGHLVFLKNAKKMGGFLTVALESDEFIHAVKHKRPIHNQIQRAQILASFVMVDAVILLPFFKSDEDYFQLVQSLKPKIIAVTQNDPNISKKQEQAKMVGANVEIATDVIGQFTSSKIAFYASISGN